MDNSEFAYGFRVEMPQKKFHVGFQRSASALFSSDLAAPQREQSLEECRLRNDRESYFDLVANLHAQFILSDPVLTARLWDEVDERGMDLGRIIHLLYGCSVHDDVEVLRRADESYLQLVEPDGDQGRH